MRHACFLALLVGALPGAAAADGFVEVAGGVMTPGCCRQWPDLANASPKLAMRAGSMDRERADQVLAVDWTPIRLDAADTSAHRFRMVGSYVFNGRAGALDLSARAGVGLDFLRISRSSASDTLIGYAVEVGAGVWYATGSVEIGGDIGIPFGVNGNATVGDLRIDSYVSMDVDLLLGVRHVWR